MAGAMRSRAVRTWCIAAVMTIFAVAISVEFLDRPVAVLTYRAFGRLMIVREFAGTPSFFGPLEVFIRLIFLLRRMARYPLAHADTALALCEASLLATKLSVSQIKFIFGRSWPLHGHPSFLITAPTDLISSLQVPNSRLSRPAIRHRSARWGACYG